MLEIILFTCVILGCVVEVKASLNPNATGASYIDSTVISGAMSESATNNLFQKIEYKP